MSAVITQVVGILNKPSLQLSVDGRPVCEKWIAEQKNGGLSATIQELRETAIRIKAVENWQQVEVEV